ncbi:MAG: hypothetical protein EPO65_02220 [Dehalococcoidia bacterium]|nr:MAG: hypothetical protein EPO65_02220 [Dehalococcoidia bacterium]
MQAFLAILRYDLGLLFRSWITRIWIPLLVAPALFLVVVAANENELASETFALYVRAVLIPISGIAIAVLGTGAISGESGVLADGILSRSVTRTEYISAKIVARLGFAATVTLGALIPFVYLIGRYAEPDTSWAGVFVGLMIVLLLLLFLGAIGITLSTILSNVLLATLILFLGVTLSGAALQFLGLTWMSATAVLLELPATFRGETNWWELLRVFLVFSTLTAAAVGTSFAVFRRRDL